MPALYELRVESLFSAAHALRGHDGACERPHGHNWKVELEVSSVSLDSLGLAMDFHALQALLREVLADLDHCDLSAHPAFSRENASCENVARLIHGRVRERLPRGARLEAVRVEEAPGCSVRYRETGE